MSASTAPPILFETAAGVATITLNRPEVYNALDLPLADALLAALIRCDEDASVHVVLLTGQGAGFCAGGDITPMLDPAPAYGGTPQYLKTLTVRAHAAVATIARMPKPVVAAVNGVAAGVGFSFAVACDLVVAAEDARFTLAYTAIGLAPDGGATFFLPRLVGPKRAFALMCSNRALSSVEARDLGIVNEIFPTAGFATRAQEYARTLASGPAPAFACAKKLVTLSAECSLETQMEHERRAIAACSSTDEFRTRAGAFVARRRRGAGGSRP